MKKNYQLACLSITLWTCLISTIEANNEVRDLTYNPFLRPSFLIIKDDIEIDFSKQAEKENIDLRAVIYDGEDSMVNLGGIIIKVGETTQGYKLLSVKNKNVTFLKNNSTMTIKINNK